MPFDYFSECLFTCVGIKVLLLLPKIPELPLGNRQFGGPEIFFNPSFAQTKVSEVALGSLVPVEAFADALE